MHTHGPLPGTVVWIRARRWCVQRARRERDIVRLDVAGRDRQVTYLAPFDHAVPVGRRRRPGRVRRQEALARLSGSLAGAFNARTIASAVRARIDVLPHQLEPVLALQAGCRRVLIADQVGLGKTVQAGLAIAETIRRRGTARVLVIVPAALRDQWAAELTTRFSVEATGVDRGSLDRTARGSLRGDDPWRRPGVWIASADYLKQPHVLGALPLQPWDLVVIDEAHDVCGLSDRHAACDEIARRSRAILLLTATPHSGDSVRFDRLCAIGAHDGLADGLTVFRRTRTVNGVGPSRHLRWHGVRLSEPETRLLDTLASFERAVLAQASTAQRDGACVLLSVLRKRALSTSAALLRSLDRRLAWLDGSVPASETAWQQPSLFFEDDRDELGDDERAGLVAESGLAPRQEMAWLRRLRAIAIVAARAESKVERLAAIVSRSHEPLIVFTEFRDSLACVTRRLERARTLAVIHGGQSPAERRRALDSFDSGTASVLVATDVAGQGLNLQARSRWVVNLELPWNPARLEQRIGRVDRIGQRRTVHATMLVARHAAESGLLARLSRRVLTASSALGDAVLPQIPPSIAALVPALASGADVPIETCTPTVRTCQRWVRQARHVARSIDHQQHLARRWRAPSPQMGSAVCARVTTPHLAGPGGGRVVLVYSVPIVDDAGLVVEQHVVAVQLRADTARAWRRKEQIEEASIAATHHLRHRLKRLACMRQRQLDRSLDIERAITAHLQAMARPGAAEPGLFDRSAAREFEAAHTLSLDVADDARARTTDMLQGATVRIGPPQLDVVLETL